MIGFWLKKRGIGKGMEGQIIKVDGIAIYVD
jgi:hypothetical protein